MPNFKPAQRLAQLPPYLFAEIDRVKNEVKAKGVDIIDLGVGDPDLPTPDFIIESMNKAITKGENHRYPSYSGMNTFRECVAKWYDTRFGVRLDPKAQVLSLIGSKEGLAHFPLAYVDPGDLVITSTPNYPVYPIATMFAGGEIYFAPLTEDNDFLPDLEAISPDIWKKAKIFFLNYPNNPTSAMAPRSFYEQLIAKAKEYNTILVHDAAYSEMYYNSANKPLSILEIPGAMDVAIEFHSLSKTYNMTGWRVGMAVGNAELVQGLGKIKSNIDSGIFQAVQEAGITALEKGESFAQEMRDIYKGRRDVAVAELCKIGLDCRSPEATFYIWTKVPKGLDSAGFVTKVLQETGVVVTPGNGFGAPGEGYFRIALTVGEDRLREALGRIAKL
ncbi:LL-diaminopimelate aminotransferase apoenzyme [Desulfonatronum thiosulfatophilum]|uniref:Aminotransferase n=1 Tax=Desulfonatronum thiosulfatophilum TaxID=617002 RepID=A0A1G6CIB1_9BACT|nr:LL-diaminopimelate aminotransferase [Desulfonatronum thiosulfatophilum]SDB32617.1 LL-diaminopimelate aminotransferase apoenzyme [Desulfonatronum thiosulfatophilum]